MFYIIQRNTFKQVHFGLLTEALQRYGLEYEVANCIPFLNEVEFTTERKDVFCFGAYGMGTNYKRYGWTPGSLMNENHNFEVYSKKYGLENLLNGDGYIINFTDKIPLKDDSFFVRPTKDTKVFPGQVYQKDEWEWYVSHCVENNTQNIITDETKVLISKLKHIQQEVRCWVVGGKVVTASRYKLGSNPDFKNYDDESFYVDFAQKMVDIYQPARAFVLDVCLSNDELKIVEVNNINSSGFYHADLSKLLLALENEFNRG
jgi:hypothetical protein